MNVLAIFGPTASGKTAVAEAIADRIPAVLVSADSMQVYRGVPVLTAQPTRPTRLVAIWELDHEASVVEYQLLAHRVIDETLRAGETPVVSGGTGLYLRAALADIPFRPPPASEQRERWEAAYDRLGSEAAHGLLAAADPAAAVRIHRNDRRRVVRALELAESGFSLVPDRNALWSEDSRHPTLVVGLEVPAAELERRIARRAHEMIAGGALDEAAAAVARPLSRTALHIIGLRELVDLPPAEAEEALVLRTRRYAAYQRKWMRRIPGLATVAADRPPGEIADEILEMARSRERLPAHRGAGRG